ncbi:hypothetical protein RJ639_009912 [Escallonia herrerae]|uniref:Histone-lysine N-methyltransferase n=1 Tax=Escallonia herrerae TaxID=1293975 RepID=A0AA88VS34_9ASTE|nr:hypothetical protein RJ639_009912 [Escallonia herrerae]
MLSLIPPVEEILCGFKEGVLSMDPNCAVERLSASLQSCEPFGLTDIDSSKRLAAPDSTGTSVRVSDFNSINVDESPEQGTSDGGDDVRLDDSSPDIECSSPWSSHMTKVRRKTEKGKGVINCSKTGKKKKPLLDLVFLKVARRRRSCLQGRSCLQRQTRSSIWGSLGNIGEILKQNAGLDVNKIRHKDSLRTSSGQGGQSSQCNGVENRVSTGRIRLRVKLGKDVVQSCLMDAAPVIDNNLGKHWGVMTELPKITKDIESNLYGAAMSSEGMRGKLAADSGDNRNGFPSPEEVEAPAGNSCMDPGTSPDSEVINVISDTQISGKTVEDLHDALTSSQDCVASRDLTSLPQTSSENGKECNKPQQASSENNGHQGKLRDCFCMSEDSAIGNASGTTSGSDGVSMDFQPKSRVNDFGVSIDTSKVESFVEGNQCSSLGVGLESPESQTSEPLRYCNVPKGRKVSKISRSKGMSRSGNACRPDEKQANSVDKHKVNEKDDGSLVVCNVESDPVADIPSLDGCDKTKSRGICSSGNVSKLEMVPNGVGNQYVPPRNAWVCCDDCCKWRRIAAELADSIAETNSRWICKDNMDKVFADCSIPQEKSNADINAELEISDASGEEDARDAHRLNFNSVGQKQSTVPQKSSWKLIRTNLFLHRNRKNQAIDENAVMDGNLLTSSCFYLSDIKGGCRFAGVTWLRWHRKAVEVGEGGSAGSTIVVGSSGDRRRKNKEQSWWKGWWIMVCQCKAPRDGRMGCGEGCLNRMLNIECVKGTCPCGELCSNQQFQKRKYAKLKCFKCGKKGYGLQLQEDLPKGQFLIEYVGEVLDMHAYEARQKEYALNGHKHFYFMTLNGSEVIDACAKGNLGRFINHSCEPNCRTEKWMVNGEVCIGLFAMRDIKKVDSLRTSRSGYFVEKVVLCLSAQSELMVLYLCLGRNCILLPIDMDSGEELTFDYNYVRVFGAAAKKCVCGSSQCRGYIGGDPLNAEVIIQDDSDEEFLEPDMVFEDGDKNLHSIISATISSTGTERQGEENLLNMEEMEKNRRPAGHLKITKEMQASETFLDLKDGIRKSTKKNKPSKKLDASSKVEGLVPCSVQPSETLVQLDDVKSDITSAAQESLNGPLCAVQTRESSSLTTVVSKLPPDTSDVKRKSKYYIVDKHAVAESVPLIKSSLSLPSVKKGKLKNNTVNANKHREVDNKSPAVPYIAKKLVESSNDRFEAVQEKLNELLDAAGGISKRKDASRGYLKLLFLTAASGDNGNGEAIQSNRDLSMILDALLKTKSRTVLVDILNKNGLQMLHNIMKRYRREYKKIPILRKLLKILEYLATREILTLEHIASGPPYPGVER